MMTSKRKPEEDGITSKLPNDVLCNILSFLPINEAIATSTLSTRWRFLWTMVPSLHVECSKPIMQHYGRVTTFLRLFTTQNFTRFRLICNNRDEDCCSRHVEEWVSAVAARKIEQLDIFIGTCRHTRVLSFPALFKCNTIVAVNIDGPFDLAIPPPSATAVHLSKLKTMRLFNVNTFPDPNISSLISRSPALELLHVRRHGHCFQDLMILLKYKSNHRDTIQLFHTNAVYNIVLTQNEHCGDYDFISDYLESHRWPNIVKARVDLKICYESKGTVYAILEGLRNVESLSLKYYRDDEDNNLHPLMSTSSSLDLPLFKNLVELRLFLLRDDPLFMELPADKCPKLEFVEYNMMDEWDNLERRHQYNISGVREHDLSPSVTFLPIKPTWKRL